jgi:hypothetical protein
MRGQEEEKEIQGVEWLRERIVEAGAIQSQGRNYEPLPKRVPRVR